MEEEEGVGEVNSSNKVKVHQRLAEEVGQKEAELMLVVEEVVMATQLLLQHLVGNKAKMVVKTSLHQSLSDNPMEAVGAVGEEGMAVGGAVVPQVEVARRRQKERQMLLPLKREVHSQQPIRTLKH